MVELADNPCFPLPADYNDLAPEKQRVARVALMCKNDTPEDCVLAWAFMRSYYLETIPRAGITWYGRKLYESPPAHYQFVYDLHRFPRNVIIWPRFAGKSFVLLEVYLLWMLTRPNFSVLHVKADERFVTKDLGKLKRQLVRNPRIIEDFGELRAAKGDGGTWNASDMELDNGFSIYGRSILGNILGFHTDFVGMDDVEFDDKNPEKQAERTERMKHVWTLHVVPMLDEGCTALVMGTMNSRRTFTYYLAATKIEDDARLAFFQRTIHPIRYPDGSLFWPDKWDDERIEELREEMGSQAFNTMFMNRPGSDEECTLPLHTQLSYYRVDRSDDDLSTNPLASNAALVTYDRMFSEVTQTVEIVKLERPFGAAVGRMGRILLVDPIKKVGMKTDFACVMVLGIDAVKRPQDKRRTERWFVLDIRLGRVDDAVLVAWIWELGCMWQAPLVGVEAVGIQKRLSESTQLQLDALASRGVSGYRLKVIPIVYSKIYKGVNAKPERIKRIAWRFEGGHIKLPYDLAHRAGTDFFELHTQIQNFTPDMKLLPHDDAIDTLAMGGFCPRPRGTYEARVETQDPMRLIEEGKLYFPGTRMPLAMAVSTQELSPKAMEVLEERAMRGPKKVRGAYRPRRGRRSRLARRRGIQVRRRVGV